MAVAAIFFFFFFPHDSTFPHFSTLLFERDMHLYVLLSYINTDSRVVFSIQTCKGIG